MQFSGRRIAVVTITLLVLLDVARSFYARLGAATPTTLRSPDPAYARRIAWPPGSHLPPTASLGMKVYAKHCAVCHGPEGHGNGPAAPSLHPRPRDFTSGTFKLKSTPGNQPPTRADVRATIKRGMPGSSMPAWKHILSDAETGAVAEYVRTLGPYDTWAPEQVTPIVASAVLAGGSPRRGRVLYDDSGCASCHGRDGRGNGPSAKDLKDVWGQADPPRDLTAPWTFRGSDRPDALYTRIAFGINGTPMPGYAEVLKPTDIAALVAYVRSSRRPPPWKPGGKLDGPGQSPDPVRRGAYLVRTGMCGLCHTPVDPDGIYLADTHYLAGGMKVEAGAHGIFFSRNLTPDPDTGLGRWTPEQIATAIRTGHTPSRRLNFWGMPWMVLGALTPQDALAIARYLRTVPAVHNRIPKPLHYGFIETVGRKLTYSWPALVPDHLAYYAGNFGYDRSTPLPRGLPQSILIWAQLVVLVTGSLAFIFARKPRGPGLQRSLGLTLIGALFLVALVGGSVVIYRYPALDVIPAESVVTAIASTIPKVQTDGLPAHTRTLLRRGRYLYSIASCPYCHNGNGAGGGKVNWSVFGTTWAGNLTAHSTGLGNWSDAEVLRAMASGVGRYGRALHWQAMIWDHFSNYAVEDQHALLAYLRALPPVKHRRPRAVSPGANDCPGDTFWLGPSSTRSGCR
ncbi:MAG: c-type cytochrome [Candidatus Binatia bacterium]